MIDFLDFMNRGGLVMYPIAFISVVALTIFIERLLALTKTRIAPQDFITQIHELINKQEYDQAKDLVAKNNSAVSSLLQQILHKRKAPIPLIKESVEEQGRQESARLERFVGTLGTIASIAPLLGVLGTVLGMIVAFQAVNESGYANPIDMAAGVWKALLTTAFGLSVGIAALVGHRYLLTKIDNLVLLLEKESVRFFDLVQSKQE